MYRLVVACFLCIAVFHCAVADVQQSLAYNFKGYMWMKGRPATKHVQCLAGTPLSVRRRTVCAQQCLQNHDCCAFSHNDVTNECCLSEFCLYSPDVTTAQQGWKLYSRKNVLCLNMDPAKKTNYSGAGPLCTSYGGTLATPDQLQQAFNNGFDVCRWGWLTDKTLRYPIQVPRVNCGGADKMPRIHSILDPSLDTEKDVYCHFNEEAAVSSNTACWPLQ